MTSFDLIDYFTDPSLISDPYPYLASLRAKGPVVRLPQHGVVAVTGYEEATAVLKDVETFSNCINLGGPFPPLPFKPVGDDISDQIEAHRELFPMHDQMAIMDPPEHTRARGLLNRLLTPRRLKENEDFMWRLADRHLDALCMKDSCEFVAEYAKPFSAVVIADLLGVPDGDHQEFCALLGVGDPPLGALDHSSVGGPLAALNQKFRDYIEDRRSMPCDDVLTALATAHYPDGSLPAVMDVVRVATLLFAAGQETTAKLLGTALQVLGDNPIIQEHLRRDRSLIPSFVEESLRMESSVKSIFRLARRSTAIGGIDIDAGTVVMVSLGAVNRDPLRFEEPHEFRTDRKNVREQVAFSRGIHTCPGAPLARAEARISLERILDRFSDVTIDNIKHGPIDNRRYTYEPTYMLRGLTELRLRYSVA